MFSSLRCIELSRPSDLRTEDLDLSFQFKNNPIANRNNGYMIESATNDSLLRDAQPNVEFGPNYGYKDGIADSEGFDGQYNDDMIFRNAPDASIANFNVQNNYQTGFPTFNSYESKIKSPNFNLNQQDAAMPSLNFDKWNVNVPNSNVQEIKQNKPKVEIRTLPQEIPSFNIRKPNTIIPDMNIQQIQREVPDMRFESVNQKMPEINVQTIHQQKPNINVQTVNQSIPNVNVEPQYRKIPNFDVKNANLNVPNFNASNPNLYKPAVNVVRNDVNFPEINPSYLNNQNLPNINIKEQNQNMPILNIGTFDQRLPQLNIGKQITNMPNFSVDKQNVDLPQVNIQNKSVGLPSINLAAQNANMPNIDIQNFSTQMPNVNIKKQDADIPNILIQDMKIQKPSINIQNQTMAIPNLEISQPNQLKSPHVDLNARYNYETPNLAFKMPKVTEVDNFNIGQPKHDKYKDIMLNHSNQALAPDVNFENINQEDANIQTPHYLITSAPNVQLGSFDKQNAPNVDLKGFEIGNPFLRLPTFTNNDVPDYTDQEEIRQRAAGDDFSFEQVLDIQHTISTNQKEHNGYGFNLSQNAPSFADVNPNIFDRDHSSNTNLSNFYQNSDNLEIADLNVTSLPISGTPEIFSDADPEVRFARFHNKDINVDLYKVQAPDSPDNNLPAFHHVDQKVHLVSLNPKQNPQNSSNDDKIVPQPYVNLKNIILNDQNAEPRATLNTTNPNFNTAQVPVMKGNNNFFETHSNTALDVQMPNSYNYNVPQPDAFTFRLPPFNSNNRNSNLNDWSNAYNLYSRPNNSNNVPYVNFGESGGRRFENSNPSKPYEVDNSPFSYGKKNGQPYLYIGDNLN